MGILDFWKKKGDADNTGGQKESSAAPKKTLGMFEVKGELGRGSMGVVYLGLEPASDRDVAIKTMTLAADFNAEAMGDVKDRFLREARILTWLDHPDIVTIYDVGEEDGQAYIAMELLNGVELSEHTKEGFLLPLPKVLDIMARVADALDYAHEQDVVHRDIKPANIMYNAETDTVKLTDFGISRLTNNSVTRAGLVMGSALYMSPEQVRGKPITGHSDLFSLGTSIYQMVCGRLPFEADTDINVMFRIAREPHADILKFNPDLPPALCAVIDKALEKDIAARYQSGAEMAEAIRQCAKEL
jgi:eukaryotic-like serine/threonine-protein kinase